MADSAAEPLIAGNPGVPREYDEDIHADDDAAVDESALTKPGRFIWVLTFCAGVSGLLFGYEYVRPFAPTRPISCYSMHNEREVMPILTGTPALASYPRPSSPSMRTSPPAP
jgi:hypothetical protein